MHRGDDGWVGGGIYFASTPQQAANKTQHGKDCLVEAKVALGKSKVVRALSWTAKENFTQLHQQGFDSVHLKGPPTGDEFVIYNYDQVLSFNIKIIKK